MTAAHMPAARLIDYELPGAASVSDLIRCGARAFDRAGLDYRKEIKNEYKQKKQN